MYRIAITLECHICRCRKDRVLNVPDNCIVGTPRFSCTECLGNRYDAPAQIRVEDWIARVSHVGWKCAFCGIPLTLENLRCFRTQPIMLTSCVPACPHCKWQKTVKHSHANFGARAA